MTADRELLELAAKAAGMAVLERPWKEADGWFFCEHHGKPAMHFRNFKEPHRYSTPWLPLTDDGDALRLAVKFRLSIIFGANYVIVGGEQSPTVNNSNDPYVVVRRAIVRAAAGVGKAMP